MFTPPYRRAPLGTCLLLLLLATVASPRPAAAQGSEALFQQGVAWRLDLLVNSQDWERLKTDYLSDTYYPADLRWNGVTVRNIGIRSRGAGSRSGTKPALRLDFDRYSTAQTFLGLKSLVLDNLWQDATGIRELVAMRLYERLGLPSPREVHAQLYVNGAPAGTYAIVESIDKDFLARVFGARDGDVENDGYLFDYEYAQEWRFEYLGDDLDAYAALFPAETHEDAPAAELYGPVEQFLRTISTAADDMVSDQVATYLDVGIFLKYVAAQNYLAQWDGVLGYAGANNFYLYRFEGTVRSQFIAWDEDNAFHASDFPITSGHDENALMRRLMRVPALQAAYFDALLAVAASATDAAAEGEPGWLQQEIANQAALVEPLLLADPLKPFSNEEVLGQGAALAAFPAVRSDFVRCEVARLTNAPGQADCAVATASAESR